MNWRKVVSFAIMVFICNYCDSATILNFQRCNYNGFTCIKNHIIFQCPQTTNNYLLQINYFNSPSTIESLTLKNCQNLTISTRCSSDRRNIKSLTIENINRLIIQRSQYNSHLPEFVKFENITYIETIPSFTFSQVYKNYHTTGCIVPTIDFNKLIFTNVVIDTVQTNAILMTNNTKSVTFNNVTINRIQNSAIEIVFGKQGDFKFLNGGSDVVEHLGFQITAETVMFNGNKFVDIAASGINGTMTNFSFISNTVNTLQPHSISILSKNVNVSYNRIENMKGGALDKIGPGLLEDSKKNFGTLRFRYEFTDNTIGYLDSLSLHPDMVAYENIASEFNVKRNKLLCSCENLGWIFSKLGHGYNTELYTGFYEILLDNKNSNNCSNTFTCQLPISNMNNTIVNEKCMEQQEIQDLCKVSKSTTVYVPKEMKTNAVTTIKPRRGSFFLRSTSSTAYHQTQHIYAIFIMNFFVLLTLI